MEQDQHDTAAWASVEDVADYTRRVDARVRAVLGEVMAQRRSAGVALDYVAALSPSARANCWQLAESAGHEGWGRMQALLGSYRWDWKDLRAKLPALAAAWVPDPDGDLVGPGLAIDETAQLKHGDATACVAPQHAGCTGKVENCVTTVFSAYVTAGGQAWVDFDVYMPQRWAGDLPRRDAAGIPTDLEFTTKPQLAMQQLQRLMAAGLPARWVAFDEVYGRSEQLRKKAAAAGLAYAAIIPCDYPVTTAAGTTTRAEAAITSAVFERRSCGNGSAGPRYSDWAMTATGITGQYLLIRRLISRPDQYTFYLSAPRKRSAVFPVQRGEIGGNISGSDGLPGLERVTGENSMPGNRLPGPGVWDGVPGGPRDMAKAGLPEVQSPEGAIRTPAGKTPVTGAAPAVGRRCACRNPRERSDAQRGHSRR